MELEEFLKKYNCEMNTEEISKIEDPRIMAIKKKYWNLKLKAFHNEYEINDWELNGVLDEYSKAERKELEDYYNSELNM